jgi:low temperature requirement protein LtrA
MRFGARENLLRERGDHAHGRVTFVELFFDLVFVFAVTQLSHALLEHLTPLGLAQTTLLFLAVWWVWIYTTWVTNWLDPRYTAVRLMLFALMLAGLILSTSIPKAFETAGLAFAGAYVFMQVGRSLFMLWCVRNHSAANFRNFQRICAWLAFAGLFWIVGALTDGTAQLGLWSVALFIEYLAAWAGFWTPGLGRSTTADWDVEGHHMAERCGLFIIIALGESVLVTGATFARLALSPLTVAAFATAFVGSVAMWWIYFNIGAERASRHIATTADPGRQARMAYTYLHIPLVAGIIVAAVADELVLAHPSGHIDDKTIAAILGGPALYLFGNLLFKRTVYGLFPLSHIAGLLLLAALFPVAHSFSPILLAAAATLALVVVAIWETRSLRPRPQAGAGRQPAD